MPFEVKITRAENGWIATLLRDSTINQYDQTFVFNDDVEIVADATMACAESLRDALQTVFADFTRSKHQPGLVLDVRPSRETEEHEHQRGHVD